ncbi:MAG: Biotin/lipoyl attachment protein [Candidatus Saccharibacteria bacterium]|nr:Biotin/lipoyl attachment protein [Candidatus Saccharibacteria bacterium]
MKFTSRVRFIFGILVVIFIVGALSMYLNGIMSVSQSSKAELAADSTTVGTDYPGLIVKQNIEEGDKVTKGQVLFEIQSTQLNDALTKGLITTSSLSFSVDSTTNYIQLKANDAGVIEKIDYRAGSYVPAGAIVASVDTVGSLYVVAHFHLSPPDYARISKTNKVSLRLPDNSTQTATIFSVALVSNGDIVDTVVKARISNADISDFRFSVGTPVEATLQLNQDNIFQGLFTSIQQLFKPLGH